MMQVEPRFFTTSLLPVTERLVLRGGRWQRIKLRVRVGYFHHPHLGHCLVDTGYAARLTRPDRSHSMPLALYRRLIRPSTLNDNPLRRGLQRLGISPSDIETVILTHLHADHISGLADLPRARILCAQSAWRRFRQQGRLRNAREGVFAELLPEDFADRLRLFEDAPTRPAPLGIGTGFDLSGDGSVMAVDLPGHLAGHSGLCFQGSSGPLLYATDAQWLLQAIVEDRCPGFPASLIIHDRISAQGSVERIRAFIAAGGEVILCHDPRPHRLDIDPEVGG